VKWENFFDRKPKSIEKGRKTHDRTAAEEPREAGPKHQHHCWTFVKAEEEVTTTT
jgi:hypothetical protein